MMAKGKCVDCGVEGDGLHEHHPLGRDVDREFKVLLCPKCHGWQHTKLQVLAYNAAARAFGEWLDQELLARRYPTAVERDAKLKELGYLPSPDGWEQFPPGAVFIELYRLEENGWITEAQAREMYSRLVTPRLTGQAKSNLDDVLSQFYKVPVWTT